MAKKKRKKTEFKHLFFPHKHNEYRPHAFRHRMLTLYSFVLLSSQVLLGVTYVSGPTLTADNIEVLKQNVIQLTNDERVKDGESALTENKALDLAAQTKLDDMFTRNYWDHVAPDGKQAWDFINATDYQYVYAGENLARGFLDAKSSMNAWMNSPSHRKNILNPNYRDIGVAVGYGKINDKSTVLIVQIFGAQPTSVAANETKVQKIESVPLGESKTSPTFSGSNITIVNRLPYLAFWLILFALIIFDGLSIRRLGYHKSKKHMFQFRAALLINIFVLILLSLNYVSIA
ncbi:MAG: CAP domain-containing protein [bacterium]